MKDNFCIFYKPTKHWVKKMFVQTKKILYLSIWILQFLNERKKVAIEPYDKQIWSVIIPVISNETCMQIDSI